MLETFFQWRMESIMSMPLFMQYIVKYKSS